MEDRHRRQIALWLFACAGTVLATLVVGGATRLTRSGLSIVEWKPVTGILPPLSATAWEGEFARYRQTPEYRKVNAGMSLDDFQRIYWWEYAHRLVARLNGVVFLVPFLYFLARRRIDRGLVPSLVFVFLLGGAQGALGWFMVRSGLVDDPRVSPLRLTAHLALAFAIFALLVGWALRLLAGREEDADPALRPVRRIGAAVVAGVFLMVLTGGMVAGLRAGLLYNTFPLMDGHLVPPLAFAGRPILRDLVSNPATAQFDHRLGAWLLAGLVPVFWMAVRLSPATRRARLAAHLLLAGLVAQVTLGAATVLLAVPVALGVAHQAGAMALLALALWARHELRARANPP
jgi:cytochrome c oxidase assembly protein subunit 15